RQSPNARPRRADHVAGLRGDQQSERAVESARDTNVERRVARQSIETFRQSAALNAEDLATSLIETGRIARDERRSRDNPLQRPLLFDLQRELDPAILPRQRIVERHHPPSIVKEFLD